MKKKQQTKKSGLKASGISKSQKEEINQNKTNKLIMSILTVLGVIILGFIILYLTNYFFVENNNLKVNISTDKKLEYLTIAGNEELISTQKYVSDLDYTMRYDIQNFSVFKHKEQDIYKFSKDERVLFVVEKSENPNNCLTSDLNIEYSNCLIEVDDYTSNYYITKNNSTYKITIKSLKIADFPDEVKAKVNYMLNNFEILD